MERQRRYIVQVIPGEPPKYVLRNIISGLQAGRPTDDKSLAEHWCEQMNAIFDGDDHLGTIRNTDHS